VAQTKNLHTDAGKYQAGMGGWSKTLAPLFIQFIAGIKEGDRVLDVGCGTGSVTFTIAETTRAATIVGIDPSVGYLEYARANNRYPHVTFDTGDAQALPYGDAFFDCCVSSLMIQFVPDAYKSAKEMRRVTKAGGIVATCMWDNGGGMELSQRFWHAAVALNAEAKPPVTDFYGSPKTLSDLWISTGLENVETKPLVIPMEFRSFDDFWRSRLDSQGPPKDYIARLSEDGKHALRERLRLDILGDRADGPMTLQAKAWAVRGIVPKAA
jgi:ubiquinone/menaquinone biosynthesis C-methylase UbiE